MKVREVRIEKLMMVNEERLPVPYQQPTAEVGQYSARFFVNEKP
jgi:hypothetical protein